MTDEMERTLIGELIAFPDSYFSVEPRLKSSGTALFSDERYRKIFQGIMALHEKSVGVDIATLSEELRASNMLNLVGGFHGIAEIAGDAVTAAYIEDHVSILLRHAQVRQAKEIGQSILKTADDMPPEKLADRVIASLQNLKDLSSTGNTRHISEVMAEVVHNYEERKKRDGEAAVTTGFKDLDRHLGGLEETDFVVLAGRSGSGKSTVAISFILHAATSGIPVLFFSAEMSDMQHGQRMLGNRAGINYGNIRKCRLSALDEQAMLKGVEELSQLPIYTDQTGHKSIAEIESDVRKMTREKGVRLVVVDYLQKIRTDVRRARHEEVGDISTRLKNIAKETGCVVLAVTQLGRKSVDGTRPPRMEDIADADQIQRDADVGLIIHSFEKGGIHNVPPGYGGYTGLPTKNIRLLSIAKARHDSEGDLFYHFDGATGQITSVDITHNRSLPETQRDDEPAPF